MPTGAYRLSDVAPDAPARTGAYSLADVRDERGFDQAVLRDPNRRPVSAEDFMPAPKPSKGWPATIGDVARGLWNTTAGAVPETLRAASDLGNAMFGGDLDALERTKDRGTALLRAQGDQIGQAVDAARDGRASEAFGHGLAGVLPLVGPAAAAAGEKVGQGNAEGVGEGMGLALAPLATEALPRLPAAAASAGRAAGAVGRGAAVVGKAVASAAPEIAADALVSTAFGHPLPIATVPKLIRTVAGAIKESRSAKAAEAAKAVETAEALAKKKEGTRLVKTKAPSATDAISDALSGLDTADVPQSVELPPPAELPPGYEPRVSAGTKVLRAVLDKPTNAGGRLVKGAGANIESTLADALDELRQAPPEPSVQLPPQPTLPPGYTPRTTVPKPKSTAVAKPTKSTTIGQKGYFLRKPEAVIKDVPVEPAALTDVSSLPTSWRSRVDQPLVKPQGATGQQWVSEFAGELKARGLSANDAIAAVTKNKDLPPMVRLQIVSALKQVQ